MKKVFSVLLLFVILSPAFAQKRSVAVMNFSNLTGKKKLAGFSESLPESISVTLTQNSDITIVERNQIKKLLDEIELSQSGLFDPDQITEAGKLAKADVLIIGSYSGESGNLIVTMKAVDVETGKLIDGKIVEGESRVIIQKTNIAAAALGAKLSGKNLGYLSVSTTPDECDIFIDGNNAGKSPIVEYKLTEGKHRLKAVKSGYIDATTSVTIEGDEFEKWEPALNSKESLERTDIAISAFAFKPLNKNIEVGPMINMEIGQTVYKFHLAAEFGGSRNEHSEDISTPFGRVENQRRYKFYHFTGHLSFFPYLDSKYLLPYFGGFFGAGRISDYRKVAGDWEKLYENRHYFFGPKGGISIFPTSPVSLFLEGRFYFFPKEVVRNEYKSQGISGGLVPEEKKIRFGSLAIGGGVKFNF